MLPHVNSLRTMSPKVKVIGNSLRDLKTRRKLWLKLHLYLGLSAGAVFVLIGLAGSLSVFGPEIDSMLNPALKKLSGGHAQITYRPLDEIASAAKSVIPEQGKPYAFVFPDRPDEAVIITYSLPAQALEQSEWHQVLVNPYNAEVLGQRLMFDAGNPWRGTLMNFFVRFHYTLALGEAGKTLTGIVALLLLFSVSTGLILWWPKPGKLWQALTIKRHASVERFNFDLHKSAGVYFAILLLVILCSGIRMVFPAYVDDLVNLFSKLTPEPETLLSTEADHQLPISLVQVRAITDNRFPDGAYKWIFFPQGARGFYRVVKRSPLEINRTRPSRTLWLDQYSGKIIHERDPLNDSAGDAVLRWLYPLHNGEAFGLPGRILIVLAGLVPLLLYMTGIIRWLQKKRSEKIYNKQHI